MKYIFSFLLFFVLIITIIIKKNKFILVEVDISGIRGKINGPTIFCRGLYEILPYNTSKCHFIPSNISVPFFAKNKSNYFYFPYPKFNELFYKKWDKLIKLINLF